MREAGLNPEITTTKEPKLIKKKKMTESERKYHEMAKLFSKSTKFYQENKNRRQGDTQVQNALRVMMHPLSTSSHQSLLGKVYASWPDYCKQNPIYLSSEKELINESTGESFSLQVPDMIMPGLDFMDENILDKFTVSTKGQNYLG